MHPDVEKIATGHYVNIAYDEESKLYQLFKGYDGSKDQSYMLYKLSQDQLSRIMLPIGQYKKKEVRKMAKELNLEHIASKADSMDLCFTSGNLQAFLKAKAPEKDIPGDIINTEGRRLGSHQGIMNYTVGQRKGINVPVNDKLYVVSIDAATNTIVVGKEDETYSPGLLATDINWVSIPEPKNPISAEVKTRYLATPEPAEIIPVEDNKLKIVFKDKQRAITPGQVTTFYSGQMLLGGATISQVIN